MPRPKPCIGNRKPCPTRTLTTNTTSRCDRCRTERELDRGTTTQRGYGNRHQQHREYWAPIVKAGNATCRRCHRPITPGQPWDMGHDEDRSLPATPEHRGVECPEGGNRSTNANNRRSGGVGGDR